MNLGVIGLAVFHKGLLSSDGNGSFGGLCGFLYLSRIDYASKIIDEFTQQSNRKL